MSPSRIASRYELQEQLGEGGMGVVWRALDIKTGSYVAIKLMKDISDPVAVELFTKEWRVLADIAHPNIVDVRDVDVIEENRQKKPFFVMPLLRGATLAELISNASARLTPERLVEITADVCKGLQAAHQRGLVHRDLKPSNIFVMDDDTAKIIDFGVVHLAGTNSVTGQKGTFQYMSPEQAQMKEITPASDLFSMGVILYEALTRVKPFARQTVDETLQAVVKYMPPSVSETNPSINQSMSRVVHKCLAKQAIYRYSSARELSENLRKAIRNELVFDPAKIEPRIERAKAALRGNDEGFASEIVAELEAEGNLDPRISVLRMQIDTVAKQKKIRQLLESARARMEQEEIPLALEKIREVLELDPQNSDALAMRQTMEKQRSDAQIAKWFELAQTHLENRDFSAARNAAQEVLEIRRGDSRALDLLEKIESTEADAKRVREQKEHLYTSAVRAYQSGEIETALGKLERLFSVARANPSAAVPERDAIYQSFYNEVRSEHDTIHSALEDAQRQFSERNFTGAMAVCRQLLEKYPNDGTFQALKIRIEDAERQELSAYIAEVSKRVDSEPDLDRRASVLQEAHDRYPNEQQFAQQLRLIRERRDLVNSIVAKARQFDERRQYAEAINQWDILRNIHPQYPGIAFELEQCKKKRDRQTREEEHARLVEEIDALMEGRAYAKAIECANSALQDFPGDTELSGLRTLAEQGLERSRESRRLYDEGQRAEAANDLARATELFRDSLRMDSRAPAVRDSLVNVLVQRARNIVDENWREAEPLYQEASELDAKSTIVRSLRTTIAEAKRQTFVGQLLIECRELVAAGRTQEASHRISTARKEYPTDLRLEQFEAGLQKEAVESKRREERGLDRVRLLADQRVLEQNPDRGRMRDVLERSQAIRKRYPNDSEIEQTVNEIELAVKRVAKTDDLDSLFRVETIGTGTDGRPLPAPGPKRDRDKGSRKGPTPIAKPAGKVDERTKLYPSKVPAGTTSRGPTRSAGAEFEKYFQAIAQQLSAFARPGGKWSAVRLLSAVTVICAIPVIVYIATRPHIVTPPPPGPKTFKVTLDPADSVAMIDGNPLTNGTAAVGSTIQVSHLGYRTKPVQLQQESDGNIHLDPEPLHFTMQTQAKAGTVSLDDKQIGDLAEDSVDDSSLVPDGKPHEVEISAQGAPSFGVGFQVQPGARPQVTGFNANDVFVVASLGNMATVYGGKVLKNFSFGGQNIVASPNGNDLNLTQQNHEIQFQTSDGPHTLTLDISNAPVLSVQSLTAKGQLNITANVEHAKLTMDGNEVQPRKNKWIITVPGPHEFVMSAEGYDPKEWKTTYARGQNANYKFELVAKPKQALGSLLITGGTPDANVEIDDRHVGQFDPNGNLRLENLLTTGRHRLVISKANYDSLNREFSAFSGENHLTDLALTPWPTIGFQANANNVTVRLRKIGDVQFREYGVTDKVSLQPGAYEIVAEAPGYQKLSTSINLTRQNITVNLKFSATPDYEFQNPQQIEHDGAWLKPKDKNTFVIVKAGFLPTNIVFSNPGKRSLLWDKKVEWTIDLPQRNAKVHYTLEGQKLKRELIVGEKSSEKIDKKDVDASASGQPSSRSIHIHGENSRVTITNDKGIFLDDFKALGYDFSGAQIGIKTDSDFIVNHKE